MRTIFALALALALAGPAAAQELPPPPPPSDDRPLPPPPPPPAGPASASPATATPVPPPAGAAAAPAAKPKAKRHQDPPGVIGEGPIAPAGAQGALLLPDEEVSHWSMALASGLSGRWGGYPVGGENVANSSVLLYFGGQADGLWTEGYGTAARFRARLYTGGEGTLFLPSDGDLEAAWMVGRREFRFVIGRLEVGRYSGLAVQTLAQLSSLPSVEGNISFGGDKARLYYNLTPVELAYVWYYGGAHIVNSAAQQNENAAPEAATALRARLTFMVPPSVLLSLQGDYMQMWDSHDRLKAAELDAGYAVLDKTVLIDLSLRWESYTRRDNANPGAQATSDQFLGMASATLVF